MSQKVHHNLWSWTCYAMFKEVKELEFFMTGILAHYATFSMYLFGRQLDVFDESDFLHGSIPPPRGHASVAAPAWRVRLLQSSWFQQTID